MFDWLKDDEGRVDHSPTIEKKPTPPRRNDFEVGDKYYTQYGQFKAEILEIDRDLGLVTCLYNPCGSVVARFVMVESYKYCRDEIERYRLIRDDHPKIKALLIKIDKSVEMQKKYEHLFVEYTQDERENRLNRPILTTTGI